MFISNLDRQRNMVRYACPEPGCMDTGTEIIQTGQGRPT